MNHSCPAVYFFLLLVILGGGLTIPSRSSFAALFRFSNTTSGVPLSRDFPPTNVGRIPAPPVLDVRRGQSFLSVQSDSRLDPVDGRYFLASVVFRLYRFPEVQVRQTIVSKISDGIKPVGWAFGISRSATAVRPALFWRDVYGRGNWYLFDRVEILPRVWYALTLVALPGKFVNLFLEELGREENGAPKTLFTGGFSVADVGIPLSDQDLMAGAVRATKTSFRGQIASLLVAWVSKVERFRSFEDLRQFVSGGPESLVEKLDAEEVNLWLNRSRDQSRYERSITVHGQAVWAESLQLPENLPLKSGRHPRRESDISQAD